MSTHRKDAIDVLTAEAHHAHATSLQREVVELRGQIDGLDRALEAKEVTIAALVNAGVCHAFDLCRRDKRITDLQQRLERAVTANVTLRQENARLRVALRAVGFVDGQDVAAGMGGMMEQVCPWCDKVGTPDDGWAHNPGCIRQVALGAQ